MRLLAITAVGLLGVGWLSPAIAQDARPLYRVFLADGTALVSYGEWAKVDDRLVFSMPLTTDASALHLVSMPVSRIESFSMRYAVRQRSNSAKRNEC